MQSHVAHSDCQLLGTNPMTAKVEGAFLIHVHSLPNRFTTAFPIKPPAPKTVATTPLNEERPPRPRLKAAKFSWSSLFVTLNDLLRR